MFDYVKVQTIVTNYENDLLNVYDRQKILAMLNDCKRELIDSLANMPTRDSSLTTIDHNGLPRQKSTTNTLMEQRNKLMSTVNRSNLNFALHYLESVTTDQRFDAKVCLYVKQLLRQCNYHSSTF
jgi:hypothetical protein